MSKILLISNMYPNEAHPSFGIFVKNSENMLLQLGFDVERIVIFKNTGKLAKIISYISHYCRILLVGLFGKYDAIYVHYGTHNAPPLNLLKMIKRQVKIYTNLHGSDVTSEKKSELFLQKAMTKLLSNSFKVITPSSYFKELVVQKYNLASNKVEVFPSGGINQKIFRPMENRVEILTRLGLQADKKYIGFIGRLEKSKGWKVFLQAFALLKKESNFKDVQGVVVGNGRDYPEYSKTINDLGLSDNIKHFDLLPHEELVYVYNAIEVFCFPTEGESLGLVGLEAMACQKPVIGSRVGGLLDYVEDNVNGFLFEVNNIDQLTAKIKGFFSLSSQVQEEMGRLAMKKAESYSIENAKKKLKEIFGDLL